MGRAGGGWFKGLGFGADPARSQPGEKEMPNTHTQTKHSDWIPLTCFVIVSASFQGHRTKNGHNVDIYIYIRIVFSPAHTSQG